MPRALITGLTGQDGSYLAEFLLERDYEVWGMARDIDAAARHWRLRDVADRVRLVTGDLADGDSVAHAVGAAAPDEIYNLAGSSSVGRSWAQPELVAEVNAGGVERILAAIRRDAPEARLFQASSSDMFGPVVAPQDESTPLDPESPYAKAKARAHELVAAARDDGMFACSGILFNHESPRRGEDFVTRKITLGVARIAAGRQSILELGNLAPRRDWGFAGDYVEAMTAMLASSEPRDYVVGTGHAHSVRDFVDLAFRHAGLDANDHVRVDDALVRPADNPELRADPSLIDRELGWRARMALPELVATMLDADAERVAAES